MVAVVAHPEQDQGANCVYSLLVLERCSQIDSVPSPSGRIFVPSLLVVDAPVRNARQIRILAPPEICESHSLQSWEFCRVVVARERGIRGNAIVVYISSATRRDRDKMFRGEGRVVLKWSLEVVDGW